MKKRTAVNKKAIIHRGKKRIIHDEKERTLHRESKDPKRVHEPCSGCEYPKSNTCGMLCACKGPHERTGRIEKRIIWDGPDAHVVTSM